jgi:hypothetical protein
MFHLTSSRWRSCGRLNRVALELGLGALSVRIRISGWGDARPWLKFALIGCLAFDCAAAANTAFARSRNYDAGSPRGEKTAEESAPPKGPLFFVISTNKQHVSVYGSNGLYEVSPVSTGRPDHPTPHGIFSIIGKERFHRSNLYSGAPMPFMQRITWSGVAMHEGVLPGYAASHGCVRLPHEFARRLFGYTEGNERVIISRQDIVPAAISHPRLFEPKLMAAPGTGVASGSGQILQNAIALTQSSHLSGGAEKLDIAVTPDANEAAPAQKLLNPVEFAKAMKAQAAKQAEQATAALNPARYASEAKEREAREAVAAARKAEFALAGAKDLAEIADRRVKRAAADVDAAKAAVEVRAQAEAKIPEAEAALSAAQRIKTEKDQDAASGPAPSVMESLTKEAREAAVALRKAEFNLASTKDLLEAADRRVKRAAADAEAAKAVVEAKAQAEAKLAEAEGALSAAQRIKAEKDREAASSPRDEAKAKEAREAAIAARRAEIALSNARDYLEAANWRVKRTAVDIEAAKAAVDAKTQAEARLVEAETALSSARSIARDKDTALSSARDTVEAKAKEVREAAAAVRMAGIALSAARDSFETADRRVKRLAGEEEALKAAAEAKTQAEAKVAEAQAAFSAAQRVKTEKEQDAASAVKAYKDADYTRRAAADAAKSWERRLAPLSVFISRKTQRLYIRQGHIRVFDVPVTIREPEKPLGTHVFVAMPQQGTPDGQSLLRWLALTVPDANTETGDEPRRHRRRNYEDDAAAQAPAVPAASASEALDRIEIAPEAREKISEMLWAGSSLIVSDKPMSGETGEYTDFVILTR